MASYNAFNSLTPMMFRKKKDIRNERLRSKSMENVLLIDNPPKTSKKSIQERRATTSTTSGKSNGHHHPWKELSRLKTLQPVVTCVLPSLAMDFVASALLAVGATPLITEDPADMIKGLRNCKAVIVDISAPHAILEAFEENFISLSLDIPFILVASDCGVNDRKKDLLIKMLGNMVPTVITGRLGDISAVAQSVIEKYTSPMDSSDETSDLSEEDLSNHLPNVIISRDSLSRQFPDESIQLPPVMRRARLHKNKHQSPPPPGEGETSPHSPRRLASPWSSPGSPRVSSPRVSSPSPRVSSPSPRVSSPSPRVSSPRGSPRGVKRFINKKSSGLHRVPTALPRLHMKGQYRVTQMSDIKVEAAMEKAQMLCVYTSSSVHLYETNVVTSGEVVVEICNTQIAMRKLHSILPCSGAIMAAVLACVDLEEDDNTSDSIGVKHCGRALALYYVAAEEAEKMASKSDSGTISPGTLRQAFLDVLSTLSEDETKVHDRVSIFAHSEGIKSSLK